MALQVSPLAPAAFPALPPLAGVRLATAACGVRYRDRSDVCLIELAPGTAMAGVLTRSRTVGGHAIQHHFTGPAPDHFIQPVERESARCTHVVGCAGMRPHCVFITIGNRIDTDNHALAAESCHQFIDQSGSLQCRGVDGNFVGALLEHPAGTFNTAYATGDTERDIDNL